MRGPRRRAVLVTLVAIAALVAGCGVPEESTARLADAEEVPFGLLDPDREPVTASGGRISVEVYLIGSDDDSVFPVTRRVDRGGAHVVLAELERGPTELELLAGLRSALADTDAIGGVSVSDRVAEVDFAESFEDVGGSDQLAAIAQIVYTLTNRNVDAVTFSLEGESLEVPRGDGTITTDPVDRDDYPDLAPPG